MNPIDVVLCVALSPGAKMPRFATEGAACFDIAAYLPEGPVEIDPFRHAFIPTGLKVKFPKEWELQIRPRSGLSNKKQLLIPNAPGTIDSDYTGEIKIGLLNLSTESVVIADGDRIAQGKVSRIWRVEFLKVTTDEHSAMHQASKRGAEGFGSTGQ